jgi:hypothetical protein
MDPDSRDKLPPPFSQVPAKTPSAPSDLDGTLAALPPKQRNSLLQKRQENLDAIENEARRAALRHQTSSADIDKTIGTVRDFERDTRSDFTVKQDVETASGRMSIEVRKSNNLIIIVITVAIVVVVLALLMMNQ